jgi:leader peptidase (prepilin peptidase)/N-methyltransferase
MVALFTLDTAVIGLLIGAIVAAGAWRMPRGINLLKGRSRCPTCGGAIRRRDIVPVVSWFILGGRCRSCRMAIPPRYPRIETMFGIGGGLVGAGLTGSWIAATIVLVAGGVVFILIRRRAAAVALACGGLSSTEDLSTLEQSA